MIVLSTIVSPLSYLDDEVAEKYRFAIEEKCGFAGFILLGASWNVLYKAQKDHRLATTGPYALIRHSQ